MITRIRQRVEQFVEALTLALFDCRLELEGNPLIFYYDTDVVLNMIMGFELDHSSGRRSSTDEQRVVRALLSCNYFGPIHVLRPHAFELEEHLRRQTPYLHPSEQELFALRARSYLREKGIEEMMAELHYTITDRSRDPGTKVEKFLDILSKSAGSTFASLEMINGSWPRRFSRYCTNNLLSFDRLGPDIDDLLTNSASIIHQFSHILKAMRPRYSINDFQDAVALTILNRMIAEHDQGKTRDIIRFYTETVTLQQACRSNAVVRELLSYHNSLPDNKTAESNIFRNSYYFLMRAWFSDLLPEATTNSLAGLDGFAESLSGLLTLEEENFEKALRTVELDGRSVIELIDTFSRLAIMDSIWIRGRLPDSLISTVQEWTDVFAFAQGEATGTRVFEEIRGVREELEKKVSRIRIWARDFERILQASERRRQVVAGRIDEPMRDLGLVRWGYDLTQSEKDELVDIVKALLQDDSDLEIECSKLATRMEEARNNLRQCMMMCAVLWSLGRFDMIARLVQECMLRTGSDMPPSLLVIQASAEIKSGRLSRNEKHELVTRVWQLMVSLSESDRVGCLLGVGYVLYHTWKQEMVLGSDIFREESNKREEVQEWARKSFAAGEEAAFLLPRGELAWAFAINHCAYVGTVTDVEPEKTEVFFVELLKLQSLPAVWNNRFDDTIACRYLLQMEREWKATVPEHRSILMFEERIRIAEHHLARAAASDFGDIDLEEHISRLQHLKNAYMLGGKMK